MPDITNGAGSNSAAAAIKAGEAFVELAVRDKSFDKSMKTAEQKAKTWAKNVSVSFEQASGGVKAFGSGVATMAASGTADMKTLTASVLGALGPWGMLASGVFSAGAAILSLRDGTKEAVKETDKLISSLVALKKLRLEEERQRNLTDSQSVLKEFERTANDDDKERYRNINTDYRSLEMDLGAARLANNQAEMKRLRGELDRLRAEFGSGEDAAVRFATNINQNNASTVFGKIGETVAEAIREAIEKATPTLKLNFQNDRDNATMGIGSMAAGLFAAQDIDASRQGSTAFETAFQNLRASIEGMKNMQTGARGSFNGDARDFGIGGIREIDNGPKLDKIADILEKISSKEGMIMGF
jgi:hypothetical protein